MIYEHLINVVLVHVTQRLSIYKRILITLVSLIIAHFRVQTGESLLTMPISNLQRISSSLPQICSCEPDGNQCTFQTFTSCLMAKEKPLQCIKASEQVQLSRTKRDVSQQSLALVSQSRILKTMVGF